jgi:uncharacterized OB-fold protein
MNQCVYCGEVFYNVRRRCPHCFKSDNASTVYRARFARLQQALRLSRLKPNETENFQTEVLTLLRQDRGLAEIAHRLEAQYNGRYALCGTILRNLITQTG